jgi:hypothetical protein
VHVTRSEQEAAWYSGKHGSNGVITKCVGSCAGQIRGNQRASTHPADDMDAAWRHRGARGKLHR